MNTVMPSAEQFQQFKLSAAEEKPFVMVNLLRFKKDGNGEKVYNRYLNTVAPMLANAGGGLVWMGALEQVFIGTDNDRWDRVLLVSYPSRQAFLDMVARPDYQEAHLLREEGIESSALLACGAFPVPGN